MKTERNYKLLNLVVTVNILVLISIFLCPPNLEYNPVTIAEPNTFDVTFVVPEEKPVRQSLGWFWVTAYCPNECCCGEHANGFTASGKKAEGKLCATDPLIPFHLKLDIEGYGVVPVEDRGGAIKGNKIDVLFSTHEEALEWGVRYLEIFCWVKL